MTKNLVQWLYVLAGISLSSSLTAQSVLAPAAVLPVPTKEQLAWHRMEMNAFIHFTTNTFTGLEWGNGNESEKLFNPTQLNAEQWASALHAAGFKTMILTCKHHDGFCLWPSKYTAHSVKNSPYKNGKGDIVKEASDACRKFKLKFGVYLSPWDRNSLAYGKPEYINYYRNQLRELFTHYKTISEMWFDGANGGTGYYGGTNELRRINAATYYEWPATLQIVKKLQPQVLCFSDAGPDLRWVGNEKGIAGLTNWDTITPDTLFAGKSGIENLLNTGSQDGNQWIPAEVDVSIRPGWFYHASEDSLVKTPQQLFDIYLSSVGRGSTLLLNIPPDQRGLLHETDLKSIKAFSEIIRKTFKIDLSKGATVRASSYRGNSAHYAATMVNDGNNETYWSTNDDVKQGWIEIHLKQQEQIKFIVLQEYISLGQRVSSFTIEVLKGDAWIPVGHGTTIGYKRILQIDPIKTAAVRLNITGSKACPLISQIGLY